MATEAVSRRWRRFLRFRLRGLSALVLVIGVWLGWIVHTARIQRVAVAVIKQAGGTVYYDWERRNGILTSGGKPWAPAWLVDLVGVDYFGHVNDAWLGPSKISNEVIAQVGRLRRLQVLLLPPSSVSDAELAQLTGLTKLAALTSTLTRSPTPGWLV